MRRASSRRVDDRDIERALVVLSKPGPVGFIEGLTRTDVEAVAAYLQVRIPRDWVPAPEWVLIVTGHPAARAVYVHERAELEAYQRLGIKHPLRVKRPGETYDRAHAWASWREALYWEAWAREERWEVSAAAFLRTHPARAERPDRIAREVRNLAHIWNIRVAEPSALELEQARQFYRRQRMTRQEIDQWLRQSGSGRL